MGFVNSVNLREEKIFFIIGRGGESSRILDVIESELFIGEGGRGDDDESNHLITVFVEGFFREMNVLSFIERRGFFRRMYVKPMPISKNVIRVNFLEFERWRRCRGINFRGRFNNLMKFLRMLKRMVTVLANIFANTVIILLEL